MPPHRRPLAPATAVVLALALAVHAAPAAAPVPAPVAAPAPEPRTASGASEIAVAERWERSSSKRSRARKPRAGRSAKHGRRPKYGRRGKRRHNRQSGRRGKRRRKGTRRQKRKGKGKSWRGRKGTRKRRRRRTRSVRAAERERKARQARKYRGRAGRGLVVLAPPVSATCGKARLPGLARIAGGAAVTNGASYHAALFSGKRKCTGALVAPQWVLSAAHCTLRLGDLVRVGGATDAGGAARAAARIVRHTEYYRDKTRVANDVMLVRLDAPVLGASPLVLNAARAHPAPGAVVRASGYGRDAPAGARGPLRFADLDVVDASECAAKFAKAGFSMLARGVLTGIHLCANHDECDAGACFGDSGGPLVVGDGHGSPVLVGVASYGTAQCGSRHTPDVYARISAYSIWISRVTAGEVKFVALAGG